MGFIEVWRRKGDALPTAVLVMIAGDTCRTQCGQELADIWWRFVEPVATSHELRMCPLRVCASCRRAQFIRDKFKQKVVLLAGERRMLKCRRCDAVYYCDKTCQTRDWARHKKACQIQVEDM